LRSVAITGVSGYIGTRLLERLDGLEAVERVVGIDLRPPALAPAKLRFYQQDILQPFGPILRENRVDAAVHLVYVLLPSHDEARVRAIDVGGTQSFLDACREAGVGHILYLSSHSVYGAHPDNPIPLTEESPARPLPGFQYSKYKGITEGMFLDFARSNPQVCLTILRACVVMGPAADNSVTKALFKPAILGVSGFNPPMQFLHEDDLVELMVTVLLRRVPGIFNAAGSGSVPYYELARLSGKRLIALPSALLSFIMGLTWRLRLQEESPPAGLEFIKHPVVLSTEKAERELGFKFRYSSREALAAFLAARARAA